MPDHATPRLITIAISHFCDKARWALERQQIPYIEEAHPPLFHRFATRLRGGGSSVPVLVTATGTLADSTDILHYADQAPSAPTRLYPVDPELSQQVQALEAQCDTQLGPAVRTWCYFYLIRDRTRMLQVWTQGAARGEQILFSLLFPLLYPVICKALKINATTAGKALARIDQVFEHMSQLLADGRTYLVGEQFSAADLTFAALARPLLRPTRDAADQEALETLPPEMVTIIKKFRMTPAGQHALRMLEQERYSATTAQLD